MSALSFVHLMALVVASSGGGGGAAAIEPERGGAAIVLTDPTEKNIPRRTVLSVGAALVPGLILHGSGHFVGGDRQTAWRLLAVESIGLGATVAGFAGLALTGASRRLVGASVAMSVTGAGLLLGSGLADLYGVLAPPGGLGAALPFTPTIEASSGILYVHNPTFAYRWLGGTEVDFRWGRWRVGGEAWSTVAGGTVRVGGRGAFRLFGPRPARGGQPPSPMGAFTDVALTVVHHGERRGAAPFAITTGALRADGRIELGGFARSLTGSFVEWGGGVSFAAHSYGGIVDATEANDALVARVGYGFYLGRDLAPRAEVVVFYDHAHDGFAGGLKMPGLGSGPLGHFGVKTSIYLSKHWGLTADVQAGSAHVLGLGVLYRLGGGFSS